MVDPQAKAYLRTLVYAALLGLPVAVAAVAFQTMIHDATHLVWDVVPDWFDWSEPPAWYVVLATGLAGVLVAGAIRLPGHGGHSPLEGLGMSAVDPLDLVSILPAALATLSLGIVLGPEAPLIALGLGIGAIAVRLVRYEGTEAKLLTLAGAFSAIAALFGGPVVAAFLLIEVAAAAGTVPSRQLGRALLPGFVAAGTGALVFTGIEDWPGVHTTQLALPNVPSYETVRIADLAWCLPIAVGVAVVVVAIRRVAHGIAARAVNRAVAVIAVVFRAAADRPVDLVLFSGQTELPALVAEGSAGVLALVVLGKGIAYALSLGAGFRGGPVFPALAIGVAFAVMAADFLPGFETTPAIAIGLAAGTAAVLRTPFTAVLLATLLLGSSAQDVAPISVLAAAAGWLVATALPNPEDRTEAAGEEAVPAT
jgi:chloride channel protein, CIC family